MAQTRKADRSGAANKSKRADEVNALLESFYILIAERIRPEYSNLRSSEFGLLYLFDPQTNIYHLMTKDFQPNLEDILTECWREVEDTKGLFPVVSYGKTPGWKVVEFDPLVFNS